MESQLLRESKVVRQHLKDVPSQCPSLGCIGHFCLTIRRTRVRDFLVRCFIFGRIFQNILEFFESPQESEHSYTKHEVNFSKFGWQKKKRSFNPRNITNSVNTWDYFVPHYSRPFSISPGTANLKHVFYHCALAQPCFGFYQSCIRIFVFPYTFWLCLYKWSKIKTIKFKPAIFLLCERLSTLSCYSHVTTGWWDIGC